MSDSLIFQLQKIGLSEKEAKAYLAAVELGSSSVQKIARRAGIPRATMYLVLDDLKDKGLATVFQQGKKTFFSAASPEQLKELARKRVLEAKEQEQAVTDVAAEIAARGQFEDSQARPTVHFYEGAESLRSLIRDNLKQTESEIIGILSHDDAEDLLTKAGMSWDDLVKRRRRKNISRRIIYTWRRREPDKARVATNAVYIPYTDFPCKADIVVSGNRISFVPYDQPIRGVAIEDPTIARHMRDMFELLWKRARK